VPECASCGRSTDPRWRYCPWCATPQRIKLVEFFRPHPLIESEAGKGLRVSRYLGAADQERQVRFSVWREVSSSSAEAESAVSIDEAEAERLARFLVHPAAPVENEDEDEATLANG